MQQSMHRAGRHPVGASLSGSEFGRLGRRHHLATMAVVAVGMLNASTASASAASASAASASAAPVSPASVSAWAPATLNVGGSVQVSPVATLAGPSQAAMYPSGLIWDARAGDLVVADTGLNRISVFNPAGATPATPVLQFGSHGTNNGQFDTPRDVAVDAASHMYVVDAANNRIQAFDSAGGWLWTAGAVANTPGSLNTPIGISYDFANNQVMVADTGHALIKAYSPVDGGFLWAAPSGLLQSPRQARRGPDGGIWVADYSSQQVKAFHADASGSWTAAPYITLGDGLPSGHGVNQLNAPYNVAFSPDGNTVYVADTGNERLARWDISSPSNPVWRAPIGSRCPSPFPAPPTNAGCFQQLRRVSVDTSGNLWAADFWGSGIHEFDASGTAVVAGEIDGASAPAPGFAEAYGVAVGSDGTTYGVDRLNQRIERFTASTVSTPGAYLNAEGVRGTAAGQYSWPETAAVAPDGTLWVGDTRNNRLQHLSADLSSHSRPVGTSGSGLGQFNTIEGIAVAATGVVWAADTLNNRIESYDPSRGVGGFAVFGSAGTGNGAFTGPQGLAVSATNVYVADSGNNRIEELDLSGHFVAQFTGLGQPQGVTLAPDGTLWVADSMNNRIVHLSSSLTDLGDSFGGLGSGPMQFYQPHSLAVSPDGRLLLVADTYNSRVQEFSLTPVSGAASRLAFTTSPAGGASPGALLSPQPVVAVQDANGTRVSTDTSTVTIAITPGTGTAGATLSCTGGLSIPAVNGLATFSGCSVDTAGTGFTLTATDGSLSPGLSAGFNVLRPFGFNPVYSSQIFNPGGAASVVPYGGAVDGAGNTYITDSGNSRLLKLDSMGGLTVLVPPSFGLLHPRGLEADPDGQHLWVTDSDNSRLVEFDLQGNSVAVLGGPAGGGVLRSPYGVVVDATTAYVANTYRYNVVAFNRSSGAVLWSTGSASPTSTSNGCDGRALTRTRGIGMGSDGLLYVTDTDNNRIVALDTTGRCARAFGILGAGNGQLRAPRDVIGDGGAGLWVADAGNYRIQHLTLTGGFISATTGGYGSGPGQFASPLALFADRGLVDVTDTYNYNIERFSVDGSGNAVFLDRIGQGTPPAPGGFNGAWSVAYGPGGELYVADWFNHRVEKFNPDGSFALAFGSFGSRPGQLELPRGVAVSPDGSYVAVAQEANNIALFTSDGTFKGQVVASDHSGLHRPRQVAIAADNTLWIADYGNNRVLHLDMTGRILLILTHGGSLKSPQGVVPDNAGHVFVSNSGQNSVEEYDTGGNFLATLTTGGSGPTQTRGPAELTLCGPSGGQLLLIADSVNNRVLVLHTDGTPDGSFGSAGPGAGQFTSPTAVAYDANSGTVAVADFMDNRVSLWSTG